MDRIAVVSPGLLPIPPIIGGSVETDIQKLSEVASRKFKIDIYGPAHRLLPAEEKKGNLSYYRFSAKKYGDYFKTVRAHITAQKKHAIIQVENRPLFIPKTKALNPSSKYICCLHSLDHINERLIRRSVTTKIFKQCDVILVYSDYVKNQLAEMFPGAANRIRYIHLAAETEKFRPRWEPDLKKKAQQLKVKLGIPPEHKVILFVGRVIPKKGINVLLEAMEHVLKGYPSCSVVIVGSNWFGNQVPTDYYKQLRQQGAKLGKKVIFTNYVYPHKLPQYYAMADIFVCPSQWDEPFGLVNVEAMASGVPVIASARGGIPEIVDDGVNGFLVRNENDPGSFVKPILDLLRDSRKAEAFGMAGRNKVDEYFNWDRAGGQMAELYEELLGH